jgi:hypothetical protein
MLNKSTFFPAAALATLPSRLRAELGTGESPLRPLASDLAREEEELRSEACSTVRDPRLVGPILQQIRFSHTVTNTICCCDW